MRYRSIGNFESEDQLEEMFPWLKDAVFEEAMVHVHFSEPDVLCWSDGVWKDGAWKGGRWENGTWEGGVWESGWWEEGYIKSTLPPSPGQMIKIRVLENERRKR